MNIFYFKTEGNIIMASPEKHSVLIKDNIMSLV